jgi:diguanylate cyclase (GGDEF)-like protein
VDVLVSDLLSSRSGRPAGWLESSAPRAGGPRAGLPDALRRLVALLLGGSPGTGSTLTPTAATRRQRLLAYTAAEILLGMGLLAWTTVAWPLQPALDAGFGGGTVVSGTTGGLLLWLAFGLLGSLRILRAPGGAHLTLHMPFIGAAMLLGGPTAGAWVAALSSIERRELESQPWYGILANHATLTIGAVLGGLTAQLVGAALGADGGGTAWLVASVAGAAVLAVVTIALGAVTVVLRDEVAPRLFAELLVGQVGRITLIEVALVVVLAAAYAQVGWWAPLLIGGLVIVAWDNDPMPAPDPLTGLPMRRGFDRLLERGLGQLRRGLIPGATLLAIDLDGFNEVNNRFGHAVGDELLRAIGERLRAHARRTSDLAARLGGDEFAVFLPGLVDAAAALRLADDIATAIRLPIATSAGAMAVGVSIGVHVVDAWGGVPAGSTLMARADEAMFHAKADGGGVHAWDPDEPKPWDRPELRNRRG